MGLKIGSLPGHLVEIEVMAEPRTMKTEKYNEGRPGELYTTQPKDNEDRATRSQAKVEFTSVQAGGQFPVYMLQ